MDSERQTSSGGARGLYATIWRWHFYAGLYVVPFIIVLTLSGMVMLFSEEIESWRHSEKLFVSPSGQSVDVNRQLNAVHDRYPDLKIQSFQSPKEPDRSSEWGSTDAEGKSFVVFVNPYNGQVLGRLESYWRPAAFAELVHGTLLIGTIGDRLVEVAAGFGIVLVVSGIYLIWPRRRGAFRLFSFLRGTETTARAFWRDLHSSTAAVFAVALVFYLFSGLAWSGIWGEKFVQAWNTFPSPKAASTHSHASLEAPGSRTIPWNLEQRRLPLSQSGAFSSTEEGVEIDDVIRAAHKEGIGSSFVVTLPSEPAGTWMVAATTRNGGVRDPRREMTVYIDQYSGAVVEKIGWNNYGLGARTMATSLPLHLGRLGWWNRALSVLFCAAFLFIAGSGVRLWWLRRPATAFHLGAPQRVDARVPIPVILGMLVLAVSFPLTGVVIAVFQAVDLLLIRKSATLRKAFE